MKIVGKKTNKGVVIVGAEGELNVGGTYLPGFIIKWLSFFLEKPTDKEEELLLRIVMDGEINVAAILSDGLFVSKRSLDEARRRLEKKGWLKDGKISPLFLGRNGMELKLKINVT